MKGTGSRGKKGRNGGESNRAEISPTERGSLNRMSPSESMVLMAYSHFANSNRRKGRRKKRGRVESGSENDDEEGPNISFGLKEFQKQVGKLLKRSGKGRDGERVVEPALVRALFQLIASTGRVHAMCVGRKNGAERKGNRGNGRDTSRETEFNTGDKARVTLQDFTVFAYDRFV